MSSLFDSKKKSTAKSTTEPLIPANIQKAMDSVLKQAQSGGLFNIEDFSPDELEAFELIRGSIGQGGEGLGAASEFAQSLLGERGGITNEDIDYFMNPYAEKVLDPALRKMSDQAAQSRLGIQDLALGAGSFGGSRLGLMEGNVLQGLQQGVGDLTYQSLFDSYNAATDTALRSKGLGLQGATATAGLTSDMQRNTLADAAALQNIGQSQRSMSQAQSDLPLTQNQYVGNMLSSLAPLQIGTKSASTGSQISSAPMANSILGAAGAAAGIWNPSAFGTSGDGLSGMMGSIGSGISDAWGWMKGQMGYADGGPVGLHQAVQRPGRSMGGLPPQFMERFGGADMSQFMNRGGFRGNRMGPMNEVNPWSGRSTGLERAAQFQGFDRGRPRFADGGSVRQRSPQLWEYLTGRAGGPSEEDLLQSDLSIEQYKRNIADFMEKNPNTDPASNFIRSIAGVPAKRRAPSLETAEVPARPEVGFDPEALPEEVPDFIAELLGSQPTSEPTVAPAEVAAEKSFWDSLKGQPGVNKPLLMAGLALMASDKPFGQAVGEAGIVGVQTHEAGQKALADALAAKDRAALEERKVVAQETTANAAMKKAETAEKQLVQAGFKPSEINTIMSATQEQMARFMGIDPGSPEYNKLYDAALQKNARDVESLRSQGVGPTETPNLGDLLDMFPGGFPTLGDE